MLELHWTRRELGEADPADVAGIRWGLFVRSLEPTMSEDYGRQRRQLERADMAPAAREREERGDRKRAIMDLRSAEAHVAELRRLLGLDAEDVD